MRSLFAWIKSNPVSVGAFFAACFSMVWLAVIEVDGSNFMERMSQRMKEIRRIQALQHTTVKVPPAQPDDPEHQLNIAVNEAGINQLQRVYKRMNQEFREIFKLAVELNAKGHVPMLEGLFPEPSEASRPFEARNQYVYLMKSLLGGKSVQSDQSDQLPQPGHRGLKAGPPPPLSETEKMLGELEVHFLGGLLTPKSSVAALSRSEKQELDSLKAVKMREYLERYARSLHLYAHTNMASPEYPLDVGDWSKPGLRPRMTQIWEGQVGLWIQQDIMEAIFRANRVKEPRSNVTNTPVKRLIGLRVVPGYVGVSGSVGRGGIGARGVLSPSPSHSANATGGSNQVMTSLPDDFSLSPTGRRSNAMYDVRHVQLLVDLDSHQMLPFLEQLRQVNFMTVLKMDLTDIDEYQVMQEGYIYGSGDVVRAEMLIETIWLRDWTVAYMHESVRHMLGVSDQ